MLVSFQRSSSSLRFLLLVSCVLLATRPAGAWDKTCREQSQTRLALVIGNSYAGNLNVTGKKDAAVMADHLCQLGFSLPRPVIEADLTGMTTAIEQFQADIKRARDTVETIVFFFSGHGYQIGDRNFLLPVGEDIDVEKPKMPLDDVFWALSAAPESANRLVFIDACRTSVALKVKGGGTLGRVAGYQDGLSEPPAPSSKTMLSFAAGYDTAVLSGEKGGHSPYSKALLDAIREPGLELGDLLRKIKRNLEGIQSPSSQGLGLIDSPFYFKEAIPIELDVKKAHDELIIIHNKEVAYAAQGTHQKTLLLNGGKNELSFFVYNAKTFKSNQTWRVPDGWGYDVRINWPYKPKLTKCEGLDLQDCFKGEEAIPFKDGPHHGRLFQVAKATIKVDPDRWDIEVIAEPHLWKDVEIKAQSQEPLWQSSLNDLQLQENDKLKQYINVLTNLKTILGALKLEKRINIPDTNKIYAQIHGNEAFAPWAEYCMTDLVERKKRLADLGVSIDAMLENTSIKPFDSFDEALSACIWEQVRQQEGNTFEIADVVVYTAIEEDLPDAPR